MEMDGKKEVASTMQNHLTTEMLGDLLAGEIEPEDLHRRVIPHLLERCMVCRGRVEGIRRLQKTFDHWSESVVVREGREAPRQLAELLALPHEERLARAAEEESCHNWGLCQLALRHCRERVFSEPTEAEELAELAVLLAEELPGSAYHPEWVRDLQARAWAHLANSRRVLGELRAAEAALRRACRLLDKGSTGRPQIRAEILDLMASLRREQRRHPEALELLGKVLDLHRQAADHHQVGRTLLSQAKVLEEAGEVERAITLLRDVPDLLDQHEEPLLAAYARHNLLGCLVYAERYREARELVPGVRDLFRSAPEIDRMRLRWVEGRIALGLGEAAEAESAVTAVRAYFLEHEMALDAALVSLDLAVLYARDGRWEDLERVAAEVSPLFRSRDLHREALLALVLFQRAVEQRTLTLELLREMADLMRRRRN